MSDPVPVIAIDGPSGAGKGTVATLVARRLGFHILDSGAIYRLLALAVRRAGVRPDAADAVASIARDMRVEFRARAAGEPVQAWLDGEPVGDELRTEECGRDASVVAALPAVRAALLARQRAFRRPPGLVADGRDMGTVVFPSAPVKIYLVASPEERARRRHKQLMDKGINVNLGDLLGEITERDRRDEERRASPSKPAADALVVDTSHMPIEAVYERVMRAIADGGVDVP